MVIKCRYVPTRSKPRKVSRCAAARFAEKALETDSVEGVLGAVAGKLGLSVVMVVPEQGDNLINDELESYRQLLDGYIVRVEGLVVAVDDVLQLHIEKINDVLTYIPDFIINDTGNAAIDWALSIIRLAYRRLTAWLDFLYLIRDRLQGWSDDLAGVLRYMQDLREFLADLSDLSSAKPIYSGDYVC